MPAEWPQLFAAARQEARGSRWAGPAVGHGKGASKAGSWQQEEELQQAQQQRQQEEEEEQAGSPVQASKAHILAQNAAATAAAAGRSREGVDHAELSSANSRAPHEVADPQRAWDLLMSASIVVGIHTDEVGGRLRCCILGWQAF